MTVYPFQLDDDQTIIRIDDNLSELGTDAINQLRSAVFAIEKELGTNPSGSLTSVASRLDVSINPNGTIKSSALTSVGLATLPIDNAQVGASAGIVETKLALDFSTANLNAQITANSGLLTTTAAFVATTNADLLSHIAGATLLSDGATAGRHVASHIDINSTPSDSRDLSFVWTGLIDKNGDVRTAATVAEALLQINDAFVDHELNTDGSAHTATGIFVDTSNFTVIPQSANTVQKSLDAIDDAAVIVIQDHQANQHSNGVPEESRSVILDNVDGYSYNIIPPTPASAFLTTCPATTPTDNNSTGDDIISFSPDNTGNLFDEKFARVSIGDVVRVNYGNGIEGVFNVDSKRHIPGTEWIVRINGTNLYPADGYEAFVRIDRKRFEKNNWGTVAVSAANNDIDSGIMPSVIVGNPKAARVLGINFDPTQLDSTHYNLHIAMYPTGDPNEAEVILPPIDVTGDQGISPGSYTIETVVSAVNDGFRAGGYNYRFMAFEHDGEFGIMMTDSVDGASFSIINGSVSSGSLISGAFGNNVVDDVNGRDALGFGALKAAVASPNFSTSYDSSIGASTFPTIIHPPLDKRNYSVNGISRDSFKTTYETTVDEPYWDGYISNRVPVGATTVEITYQVPLDLTAAELRPGKTITIQPVVDRSDPLFNEVDYGRFVIKSINFTNCCVGVDGTTSITVVNGLHASGSPVGVTGLPPLQVKLYFGEDSVGFNQSNVIDGINNNPYFRYHEIFINEEGSTFSHERARMPLQVESTSLLGTTSGFKIKSVSPKLKGFLDDGSSDINRYVRFMVTRYDTVSGEFDGYIGRRIPSSDDVTDFGRLVTTRKNVPTRFYDNTDVDYVEIEYVELNQYPGTNIMSSSSQRYVDIEIFDSLATNQENLRLAGCGLVSNRVDTVQDLREFGNVSEVDFTDSAVRFIEAGERHLHENGVIDGFTYKGEDASLSGTLKFNGGIALVNGHMSTLNAQSVSIPEIVQDTGAGQTTTLNWAICVNDEDLLVAIPVTPTKQHFFGRRISDTDNYYIQSVTFDELNNERKDLLLLYVANVTIASVTVNSVVDARKFAQNETRNIPLTLSSDPQLSTFTSFEQVKTWADNSERNVTVRLVGDMLVDEEIDLTDASNLTIEGEHGTITVTSQTGFRINSGVKLKNLNIVYNGTFSGLSSSDNLHLKEGHAGVYIEANTSDSTGVEVIGCTFTRTVTGERPPFVLVRSTTSRNINSLKINENSFTPEGTNDSFNGAAVVFYDSAETTPTGELSNVQINKNKVDNKNMIVITGDEEASGMMPMCRRVEISNNDISSGYIGYLITTHFDGYVPADTGLTIEGNSAAVITRLDAEGTFNTAGFGFVDPYGTGYVSILRNTCSAIATLILDNTGSTSRTTQPPSSMLIEGNTILLRKPYSEITAEIGSISTSGIYVTGTCEYAPCRIVNNKIIGNPNLGTSDSSFTIGISSAGVVSDIQGNFIKHWRSIGILSTHGFTVGGLISGNNLIRGGQTTGQYILASSGDLITDNKLDARTTDDASNYNTISGGSILTNKNNVKSIRVAGSTGQAGIYASAGSAGNVGSIITYASPISTDVISSNLRTVITGDSGSLFSHEGNSAATRRFMWVVALSDVLPEDCTIVDVVVTGENGSSNNSGNGAGSSPQMRVRLLNDGSILSASAYTDITSTSTAFTASLTGIDTKINPTTVIECSIEAINNTGSTGSMEIYNLDINYTY